MVGATADGRAVGDPLGEMCIRDSLRYRLDVPAELPAAAISPETRHNVFLASKEAVTNIVKHARASEAWIHLRLEPRSFKISVI